MCAYLYALFVFLQPTFFSFIYAISGEVDPQLLKML